MDYWEQAHTEIRKYFFELERIENKTESEIAFIVHAGEFGQGGPIPNYPTWSEELGPIRDRVLNEDGLSVGLPKQVLAGQLAMPKPLKGLPSGRSKVD